MIDDQIQMIYDAIKDADVALIASSDYDLKVKPSVKTDIEKLKNSCYALFKILEAARQLKISLESGNVVAAADLQTAIEESKRIVVNEQDFDKYWRIVQFVLEVKVADPIRG